MQRVTPSSNIEKKRKINNVLQGESKTDLRVKAKPIQITTLVLATPWEMLQITQDQKQRLLLHDQLTDPLILFAFSSPFPL